MLFRSYFGKFRVGADHGQGRFKLVAGVGDELFLTLGVLDHRADGQPGKRAHQPVNDEQPGQTDDDGDGRQAIGGVDAVLIIEGGDDRAAVGPLLVLVKIGAVLPEGLFLGEHFFCQGQGVGSLEAVGNYFATQLTTFAVNLLRQLDYPR